jgi:hypothetical protein
MAIVLRPLQYLPPLLPRLDSLDILAISCIAATWSYHKTRRCWSSGKGEECKCWFCGCRCSCDPNRRAAQLRFMFRDFVTKCESRFFVQRRKVYSYSKNIAYSADICFLAPNWSSAAIRTLIRHARRSQPQPMSIFCPVPLIGIGRTSWLSRSSR